MNHRTGLDRSQTLLFPERLEDYVAVENPVRFLDAFVTSLDLHTLGFAKARCASTGRPPYDPAALLKLYLYGYLHRVRSSRSLEAECHRNVEVLWLLGKLAPDFKTIADFRKDNLKPFKAVARQFTIRLGGPFQNWNRHADDQQRGGEGKLEPRFEEPCGTEAKKSQRHAADGIERRMSAVENARHEIKRDHQRGTQRGRPLFHQAGVNSQEGKDDEGATEALQPQGLQQEFQQQRKQAHVQPGNYQQVIEARLAKIVDGAGVERRAVAPQHRLQHCTVSPLRSPGRIKIINALQQALPRMFDKSRRRVGISAAGDFDHLGAANRAHPVEVFNVLHPPTKVEAAGVLVDVRLAEANIRSNGISMMDFVQPGASGGIDYFRPLHPQSNLAGGGMDATEGFDLLRLDVQTANRSRCDMA